MIDFNKNLKHLVVGFPRCGTTSFTEMTGIGSEEDLIYDPNAAQNFSKTHPDTIPIIITRDDKKAQAYSNFCRAKKMSGETRDFETTEVYEEYLDKCNYNSFIASWLTYYPNIAIYSLEELQADPDFPSAEDLWTDPHDFNVDISQATKDSMDTYIGINHT